MQSHHLLRGPVPPTSFLSLSFELREQIYRLILRSLPRVRPMLYSPTIPIYHLHHLDPRPLFVHTQIQHDVEALLASRTRILIPTNLGHNNESPLSASTEQWLGETRIEFKRIRVWSGAVLPIILDVDVVTEQEVVVLYKWRFTPGKWRIYGYGRGILRSALPVILSYLAEGLKKRITARGGTGVGIEEIQFSMEIMSRFFDWLHLHRRFRAWDPRLSAGSYERELDRLHYGKNENKEDFRRHLEWWDDIEAEVRDSRTLQSRVKLP